MSNNYEVVNDEVVNEDVVLTINDWYNKSDICNYAMPVPVSDSLNYTVVKDEVDDPKTKFHDISYSV